MNRFLVWVLLAGLASLVWLSAHLAAKRIYQVDECQYIYMARVLRAHQGSTFFTDASGFTLPLAWLDGLSPRSNDVFSRARLLMVGLFWLNLVLIALNTGEKLRSLRGLIALLAAAVLAPLWDYGFEIRHDNVLLTGLLLMWYILRVRPTGLRAYFIAGAVALGLQLFAFKAFAYTAPLSMAFLIFPPSGHKSARWKLMLAWIGGAAMAFLIARLVYESLGLWQVYLTDLHGISGASVQTERLAPWSTLGRLLTQTPLLLALVFAGLVIVAADLLRLGRTALTWDGNLPEALLFLGAAGVLFVNPNPYPYNLLQLVPFAFIFAFRYAMRLAKVLLELRTFLPAFASILIFLGLVPFWGSTRRHLDHTNTRQEQLITLAERLTDPQTDPVYDAVGMVPTRPSVGFRWFLHSLNIQSFIKGPGPRVREMLGNRPAAVFIPSYRTDWLPEEDHDFIHERYVALADDFWVLGQTLSAGGGLFEIHHAGRYRISTLKGSDLLDTCESGAKDAPKPEDPGTLTGTLDGLPFSNSPVELTVGVHRLECPSDCQPAVVWMGPHLDRIHRIGPGDHRQLFVNWY